MPLATESASASNDDAIESVAGDLNESYAIGPIDRDPTAGPNCVHLLRKYWHL